MATKLSHKELEQIKQGVQGINKMFQKLQSCKTLEDAKEVLDQNEKEGKSKWFTNFERILNKASKL